MTTYSRMFVEVFNRGSAPVSLAGLSLQAPGNGATTGAFSSLAVLPAVVLAPKQSFLVASQQFGTTPDLPIVADMFVTYVPAGGPVTGSKIALVNGAAVLACGGAVVCTSAQKAQIIDLVAFGTGNYAIPSEGTAAPFPDGVHSLQRNGNGTTDTDVNSADMSREDPLPRNMGGVVVPVPGAPALDATKGATPGDLSKFVYDSTNPNAPQTGVTAGVIDAARAGWIVGYVKDGNGAPNAGVTVTVVGQSQYGQAVTRADGRFDLVVNGSANYTLRFAKPGSFAADRSVYVGAQLTAAVEDVWLVEADPIGTPVSGSSGSLQVAAGSTVAADADSNQRTALLMIPAQTKFKKGSTELSSMTLRLTEYTAGPNGLKRMPAPLTGSPAYTYAVEISADEAAGANVDFQDSAGNPKEVFFYVNDVVGVPVGKPVPMGYYDRAKQAWIPSSSGRVIQVVITNGVTRVDIDGGGIDSPLAVDTFGIKADERAALATRYGVAGSTTTTNLWRVPITHMTPYDCNWPVLPPDCVGGLCPGPSGNPPPPSTPGCTGKCCTGAGSGGGADSDSIRTGSIIGCDSGILGETVNLAGTPYSLNYSSYRTPGYAGKRQLKVDLTGTSVLASEKLVTVDVTIAGQTHHREFTPVPNVSWTFQWDGLDGAGRPVVGTVLANVKTTTYFRSKYLEVAKFGALPSPTAPAWPSQRAYVSYERSFQSPLMGQVPSSGWALGDWTLNQHHFYDVAGNTVHLGSGGRIPSAMQVPVITRIFGDGAGTTMAPDGSSATAAGTGFDTSSGHGGVAVSPNGDVFVADTLRNRVRRIDSAGNINTVIGSGTEACPAGVFTAPNFANGASDAINSNITRPTSIAIGSDGSIYITTAREGTVRKATPSPLDHNKYLMSNFAGGSANCNATTASVAEDVLATSATFKSLSGIAIGPDGSVYVADEDAYRVRRVGLDGKIWNVAGNGTLGGPDRIDEGKLATTVPISNVNEIAVGPNGTLYIPTPYELVSVDKNGVLHFLNQAFDVSSKLANGELLSGQSVSLFLQSVAVAPSGVVIFNDNEFQRSQLSGSYARSWIRALEPSGIVSGLASTPDVDNNASLVPPPKGLALGNGPPRAHSIAAAPNGDVLVISNNSIYRISSPRLPETSVCADQSVRYLVSSGDSGFCFDANGMHKKTIDLHTGNALYTFDYDVSSGVLKSVKDSGGRITTIVKLNGNYVISPPPPGDVLQKTTISTANGRATNISDSVGTFKPTALSNGLLSQLLDGENNLFQFGYDVDGYLRTDTSPVGTQTLERSLVPGGKRATLFGPAPLSLKTVFDTTWDSAKVLTHTTTFPDLTTEVKTKTAAGDDKTLERDGTTATATATASTTTVPQLNGQIPLQSTKTVKLPSGLTMTTLRALSDPPGGPQVSTIKFDNTGSPPTQTTTRTYSSTGQTLVTVSPQGRTTTVKTDATGHVTQRQVGTLTPTDLTYINGQLSTVTQGARSTTYSYVSNSTDVDAGYLYRIQDPTSTTEIRRDVRGRPLSSEAASGTTIASRTSFTWFNNDLLKTVRTPELSKDHTFSYNAVQEISQYLPPALAGVSAPATNYTYTSDRALWTEQPSGLAAMTRMYVPATGQLDTITLPATSMSALAGTIHYDYFPTNNAGTGAAAGRVSTISGPIVGNTLQFKYDGVLRTSQTWGGEVAGEVNWTFNNRFWPIKETLVSGSTFNRFLGYDKDGLLVCNSPTTCNPAGADALKIARSAIHGGVTLIDQGGASGALETWTYSDTSADQTASPGAAFGELRAQSVSVGGTVVADIVYDAPGSGGVSERRDNLGRIRFKTETFRSATTHTNSTTKWEYRYDERGQIKQVYFGGTLGFDAVYDKNGNPKQFTTAPGIPATVCNVDAQDRLLNCGALTLTYYDNGEVKTKTNAASVWTYHYDALSRLRKVVRANGTSYEYVVDGEGRRIAKKVNGTITRRWLYGKGLSPIAELDGSGAVVARYVYGSRTNTPDLVIRDGKTYRLISDQLGSPRYAVNVANKDDVPYQVSYGPMGAATVTGGLAATSISWIPFGFAGGLYDPDTGLVHFGAREYDPEIGRWTSKDPSRFRGGSNLYMYSWNDPVNFRDATGLAPFWSEQHALNWLMHQLDRIASYPDAVGAFVDNYKDMRDANTIGADKYFHCMANCEAAARGRADVAETISDGREWLDENLKGDPASACSADQGANRHGRNSGADDEYQCRQACSTYRPNGLSPQY